MGTSSRLCSSPAGPSATPGHLHPDSPYGALAGLGRAARRGAPGGSGQWRGRRRCSWFSMAPHLHEGNHAMAHPGLRGGMSCPCAARLSALAGWGPRAPPAGPPEPVLKLTVCARSTRWRPRPRHAVAAVCHVQLTKGGDDMTLPDLDQGGGKPEGGQACATWRACRRVSPSRRL